MGQATEVPDVSWKATAKLTLRKGKVRLQDVFQSYDKSENSSYLIAEGVVGLTELWTHHVAYLRVTDAAFIVIVTNFALLTDKVSQVKRALLEPHPDGVQRTDL